MDKQLAAADKEVNKKNKEVWTEEALQAHGENLQWVVKHGAKYYRSTFTKEFGTIANKKNQQLAL